VKFDPPIEYDIGNGYSLIIHSARVDKDGRVIAEVRTYNRTIIHSDLMATGKASARKRYARTVVARVNDLSEQAIDDGVLFIDGNLSTQLAGEIDAVLSPSQATSLVEFAQDAELFHTPDGDAFVTYPVGNHKETSPVKVKAFRRWLMGRYYKQTGTAANAQAVQDALGVLESKAIFGGPQISVYTRVAEYDGKIYIDLCNEKWEVVEITSTGWRVVADPPVRFRRARGMLALPYPVAGGSISELRPFVNVAADGADADIQDNSKDRDFILMCAWLVQSLRPTGPYPVGVLHGEQGSAKSTTQRVLRSLIDPNVSPLRSEPRSEHELMIAATNGWCVALDNLSNLPLWLSDALCRLSTGGGFSARELYSDSDEVLFDAQRPVLLNGIEELATRGDLMDRAVMAYLPNIPENKRRLEKEFWAEFESARPRILGALYDAVSAALKNLPNTKLRHLPRMADFALWVAAAEQQFGFAPGAFLSAYTENRGSANEMILESSAIAAVLIAFIQEVQTWQDTATKLLESLNSRVSEKTQKQREWPKNGSALSNKLRRLAPNLRAAGVGIEFNTEGHKKTRKISLEWRGNSPSAPSADEKTEQNQQLSADAVADADSPADAAPAVCGRDTEQGVADANSNHTNDLIFTADGADAADDEKQGRSDEAPKRTGWAIWHGPEHDLAVNVTGYGEHSGQWFALTDTGGGVPASEVEFDMEGQP
jgi:ribosomal protein S16